MFLAALCTIAKPWKLSRCPSVGEWINKLWYIYTVKFYLVLKTHELSSHSKTWRHLKWIFKWKKPVWKGYVLYDSNCMTFWKRKNYGDRKIAMIARGCGVITLGVSLWDGKEVKHKWFLEQWKYDITSMDTCLYTFIKIDRTYKTKNES